MKREIERYSEKDNQTKGMLKRVISEARWEIGYKSELHKMSCLPFWKMINLGDKICNY